MFLSRLPSLFQRTPRPFLPVYPRRNIVNLQISLPPHNYKVEEVGTPDTFDYRVFIKEGKERISPWHDIPLEAGKSETNDRIFNFVNEISRGRVEKMEINLKEEWNPIKQDVKNGKLRKITYSPYLWNYGAFPQTWEDPGEKSPDTGLFGDGDPVDVVEIGTFTHSIGQVVRVKIVGALGLIDEGETDWKIIAINVFDPKAYFINGPEELEVQKPGVIHTIRDFFINYKIPDGKPKNKLAFDGEIKDQAYALKVIEDCHRQYKGMLSNPPQKNYSLKMLKKT